MDDLPARTARAVADWARIVLLPVWLVINLCVHDVSTWRTVIETTLVTLLVYLAVERRWRAFRPPQSLPAATMPNDPDARNERVEAERERGSD